MNRWFAALESVRVVYNEAIYNAPDFDKLLELPNEKHYRVEKLTIDLGHSVDVLCIYSMDNFNQFLGVLLGLKFETPIYFGQINELEGCINYKSLNHIFLIATTSGTSGRKKIILKKHKQWLDSFKDYGEIFKITEKDRLFINGSLGYTANLYSVLHLLTLGGDIVFSMDNHPRRWIETLVNEKCTTCFLVPSKLRLMLKSMKKFSNKLSIVTAGETLNEQLINEVHCLYPSIKINHYYGAAEIGHISAITHDELKTHPRSVGQAFPRVEIKIENNQIYAKSQFSQSNGFGYDSAYDFGYINSDGYLYLDGRTDSQLNIFGRKFDGKEIVRFLEDNDSIESVYFVRMGLSEKKGKDLYGLYVVTSEEVDYVTGELKRIPNWKLPTHIITSEVPPFSSIGKVDLKKIQSYF